jgi:hypothetical protein
LPVPAGPRPDALQARLDYKMLFVVARVLRRSGFGFALSHNRLLKEDVHALRIEALAVRDAEKPVQHIAAELGRTRLPGDAKMVTTTGNFDIEAAFDLPQMFVELAAKIG